MRACFSLALLAAPIALAAPAAAQTAREALIQVAFASRDKASALANLATADREVAVALARAPTDADALLAQAMARGYRAKLTRSRGDALAAKAQFEALVARNPRDAEAQAALGGWHLEAVASLGGIMARGTLGARKGAGLAALDRAVALGGDRALFPALTALLRLSLDPEDARGAELAQVASKAAAPTTLDRILQRRATALTTAIKGGNPKLVQALAKRLLPLGEVKL